MRRLVIVLRPVYMPLLSRNPPIHTNIVSAVLPVQIIPTTTATFIEAVDVDTNAVSPESYTPRNLRWGMSMDEVIAIEGTNSINRTRTTLLYFIDTAGLPSLVNYLFEENMLVKATICFADPRYSKWLPPKSRIQAEKDFARINELLSKKYGNEETTTNAISYVSQLEKAIEDETDTLTTYEREREDIMRKKDIKWRELFEQFKTWPNRETAIKKELEPYEADLRRNNEWTIKISRALEDMRKTLQKEKELERQGKRKSQMVSHWYNTGLYDIYLSIKYFQNGSQIIATYNKVKSIIVTNIPSEL